MLKKRIKGRSMEGSNTEKNFRKNKIEKKAKTIALMGLVSRDGAGFRVSPPAMRARSMDYRVRRDESGAIVCSCLEFQECILSDAAFRCEHIMAVKFALAERNTEPSARPSANAAPKTADVTKNRKSNQLLDQKGGRPVQNPILKVNSGDAAQHTNNVLDFSGTLVKLRQKIDPRFVKRREGWRNGDGSIRMIDYVEWQTIADILDAAAPHWTNSIRSIRQIGDIVTVTAAITIGGVTREGIGTGTAVSEMGIKRAEHDALKRAAVKFGIARDLYQHESATIDREGAIPVESGSPVDFPADPVAGSLGDLITARQLGMIRKISRETGINADEECVELMNCRTAELSNRAASGLIRHLQRLQDQRTGEAQTDFRRAG